MEVVLTIDGGSPLRIGLDGHAERRLRFGSAPGSELRLGGIAAAHAELVIEPQGIWLCALEPVLLQGQQLCGWSCLEGDASLLIGSHAIRIALGGGEDRAPAPPPAAPRRAPAADLAPAVPDRHQDRHEDRPEGRFEDRYAALAARFALPPEEEIAAPTAPPQPFLQQKFLNVGSGMWILASASVVVALVAFTSRRVPLALASRAPDRPGPVISPATPRPAAGRRPESVAPADVRSAAEALFARDDGKALRLYRALAARDDRYVPFVRALELRLRHQGPARR